VRARVWVPVPQVLEHVDHSVNADTMQSTAQLAVLQSWDLVCAGHAAPPPPFEEEGSVTMLRVLVCLPEPQVLVQAAQADQPDTLQSTGQAAVLQLRLWSRDRQSTPPKAGLTSTLRRRAWVPEAQDLEQAAHAPHTETTQSMGQLWVLQVLESPRLGQATPPWFTLRVIARARDWEPVPQDLEQAPQALKAETWQSTGQAVVPQAWRSSRVGHTKPPCMACWVTTRVRDWEPVPQVLVQVAQAVQADTAQWTGHGPTLQVWVLAKVGQAEPPWAASAETLRVRDWLPPPQVLVQVDQAVQPETTQSFGHDTMLHSRDSARAGQSLPP
jgi:hypothetical protein